jgi:hypothetical protein
MSRVAITVPPVRFDHSSILGLFRAGAKGRKQCYSAGRWGKTSGRTAKKARRFACTGTIDQECTTRGQYASGALPYVNHTPGY